MNSQKLRRPHILLPLLLTMVGGAGYCQTKIPGEYPRYELFDLGTFGGPNATTGAFAQTIDKRGGVAGGADTSEKGPCIDFSSAFDCFSMRAFIWRNGRLHRFGTLGGPSSIAIAINDQGVAVGSADVDAVDHFSGAPQPRAAVFEGGRRVVNLGTLGGEESLAVQINNHGRVAGQASNTVPTSISIGPVVGAFPSATETHAALWESDGSVHDLGTLGGPGSLAGFINERGQVGGLSFIDAVPTASGLPRIHSFVTVGGVMRDLGSLGGDTFMFVLTDKGRIAGVSSLATGDQHAFFWNGRLHDLGTLGGRNSSAFWMNEEGVIVGQSDVVAANTGLVFHAVTWTHRRIKDLGTLPGDTCSTAVSINERQQIVGTSGICGTPVQRFFFAQKDGPIVDVQSLVVKGPRDIALFLPTYISNSGEISGLGALPSGDVHVIALVPTRDHEGEGEDHSAYNLSWAARSSALSKVMRSRMAGVIARVR